jgi:tetratricopeptide (TPR) repeat protein
MKRASAVVFAVLFGLLLYGCVSSPQNRGIAAEYYDIGNAYVALGQYDKAIQRFEQALRLDPSLAKADYNLAMAYAHMKRTDEAIALFTQLLASDPQNPQVMSALAWTLHLGGRDEESLAQYDALLLLSPADLDALYNSGIILWKLGRTADALDRQRTLLARSPDDLDALYAAGSLLLILNDPTSAAGMLSRYLEKKPDDVEALYLAAAASEQLKKYARSMEAYDRIVALDGKQGDAWFGEARLLLTVIEDPQRGLEALAKAIDAGFKDAEAVKALLDSPGLLERNKVEAALKEHSLLPQTAPPAATTPAVRPDR